MIHKEEEIYQILRRRWIPSGNIYKEESYLNGKLHGYKKYWYSDGMFHIYCSTMDDSVHGATIEFLIQQKKPHILLRILDYLKNFINE